MELETESEAEILSIPSEIRGVIFSKLKQVDALTCRLVCRQFKEDVDEWVSFSATLDEDDGHLARVLKIRLHQINIRSLVKPPPLTGHLGTRLLENTHLLKVLTMGPHGKVCYENLHYLINDSSKSLRELKLYLNSSICLSSGMCDSYLLPELAELQLNVNTVEFGTVRGPQMTLPKDSIVCAILSSAMEKLKILKLEIRCLGYRQVSQLSGMILHQIANRWSTLRVFELDLIQGHGVPLAEEKPLHETDLQNIDLVLMKKVALIEEIKIINSTSIAISLWAELLSQQKRLNYLETDILPAPCALFRQIILNSSTTLQEVDIGDLTLDVDEDSSRPLPFDLSIFSGCCKLRKLTLDRNSMYPRRTSGLEGETTLQPELTNLLALPDTIEELNINYFLLRSDDLLELFETSGLSLNIAMLSLIQCGNIGNLGVNGSVVQKILACPRIQCIEISQLNYEDSFEAQKLNIILVAFDHPEGHDYFYLHRVEELDEFVATDQVCMDDFKP